MSRIIFLLIIFAQPLRAQLIVNEVSQGASGTKEYVELLVTGTPSCAGIPTVDLRGWYIDDNNGNHATGSGTGIASGVIRLTQDPIWSAVPIGTLIVIYNDGDLNASIPAQDLSLSDSNCRLIIPVSNCTLLEKNTTQPSTASSTYPTTGFTACGNWNPLGMSNTDDSFQTIDPSGTMVHAISWGNNSLNPVIYFAGSSGGMVCYMTNASSNNPSLQANFSRSPVAGNETPGLPNTPANAAWIASMNNNCTPIVPMDASASGTGTCSCSGMATASVTGGTGPFTYSWAPAGGNAATATGLCAGTTYTVTITSSGGCTDTAMFTIPATSPMTLSSTNVNVSCNGGNDGSASVSISGGTSPFSYSWSPSVSTGASATNLAAGQYVVTVTDSNGCSSNQTINITEPVVLSATSTQTNVSCNGGNNGSATVTLSGGTGSYTYLWSPAGGTNATANNLSQGPYVCTITDANGCSTNASVTITQPLAVSGLASHTNVTCYNGSDGTASVTAGGGAGGYTYSWSPSGGTGSSATGLTAGPYVCTITDANGCTHNVSITITQPAQLTASAGTGGNVCSNGTIALNGAAGGNYTSVQWSGGTGNFSSPGSLSTNYTPGSGDNGTVQLTLTVTDACNNTVTSTVTINVILLPVAQITAGGSTILCPGDSVQLTASGGGTYLWSTSETSATITANTTGTYSVVVSNSCGSDTATQNVSVQAGPAAQITASGPTTFCAGDSITLTANGGNSYVWSTTETSTSIVVHTAGTYSVVSTSSCGTASASVMVSILPQPNAQIAASGPTSFCAGDSVTFTASGGTNYLWSTTETTASITVTAAGTYTVAATNSCGVDTATIAVSVLPQPNAQIAASGPTTFCTGGNVTLTASGGTSYLWSTTATTPAINVNAAGTYTVATTNSCGVDTATITVALLPLPNAQIAASGPTSFCAGGNVTLTASGGTSYLWSNSASTASITVSTAGTYTVAATNNCGVDTATIVVSILPLPTAQIVPSGPTSICAGGNVTLTASGGTNYLWSNSATSAAITVTTAGTYTVVTSNSCGADTATITINVAPQPSAAIAGNTFFCPGDSTTLTASGTGNFVWSTGETSSSITVTQPGNYFVIATNSCGVDTALIIVNSSGISADFLADSTNGNLPLPVNFTDNSAPSGSTWTWDFGDGSSGSGANPSHTYITGGTFLVTMIVTDANGCSDVDTLSITVIEIPSELSIPNIFTPNADGTNDVFLIQTTGMANMQLKIFDRWGVLIANIDKVAEGWDGRNTSGQAVSDGTYYYVLTAEGYDKKIYERNGFITLMR